MGSVAGSLHDQGNLYRVLRHAGCITGMQSAFVELIFHNLTFYVVDYPTSLVLDDLQGRVQGSDRPGRGGFT